MKTCVKCKKSLSLDNFHKDSINKDGHKIRCKVCRNADNKQHRKDNSECNNIWRANNKDKIKEYDKLYRNKNKEKIQKHADLYYKNNPDKKKATDIYKKEWYEKNKDRIIKIKKERRTNNIQLRLSENLRKRLYSALKNNQKVGSAIKDLGCSIGEFKIYMESKFKSGMTWDNYGFRGWHIDHIMPLSSFDLTNYEQVKKACNYSNLQPLWAKENLRKGAKIPIK